MSDITYEKASDLSLRVAAMAAQVEALTATENSTTLLLDELETNVSDFTKMNERLRTIGTFNFARKQHLAEWSDDVSVMAVGDTGILKILADNLDKSVLMSVNAYNDLDMVAVKFHDEDATNPVVVNFNHPLLTPQNSAIPKQYRCTSANVIYIFTLFIDEDKLVSSTGAFYVMSQLSASLQFQFANTESKVAGTDSVITKTAGGATMISGSTTSRSVVMNDQIKAALEDKAPIGFMVSGFPKTYDRVGHQITSITNMRPSLKDNLYILDGRIVIDSDSCIYLIVLRKRLTRIWVEVLQHDINGGLSIVGTQDLTDTVATQTGGTSMIDNFMIVDGVIQMLVTSMSAYTYLSHLVTIEDYNTLSADLTVKSVSMTRKSKSSPYRKVKDGGKSWIIDFLPGETAGSFAGISVDLEVATIKSIATTSMETGLTLNDDGDARVFAYSDDGVLTLETWSAESDNTSVQTSSSTYADGIAHSDSVILLVKSGLSAEMSNTSLKHDFSDGYGTLVSLTDDTASVYKLAEDASTLEAELMFDRDLDADDFVLETFDRKGTKMGWTHLSISNNALTLTLLYSEHYLEKRRWMILA